MTNPAAVPSLGVVLFTDLVGSTELRSSLGDDAADDLRRQHDGILAEAVTAHSGTVVKGLGDGIMASFPGASEAVLAAVAMQRSLRRWRRRSGAALSIRVGISAGDVSWEAGDCFGTPVVEASRLCAAAAGEQILVADVVRLLAGTRGSASYAPVGPLQLKGLSGPVTTWEVDWSEPAAAPERRPVPAGLATDDQFPFVARAAERETLGRALKLASAGERRSVLLSGEPGVGKTRLCAEVARQAVEEGALVLYGRCDEELGIPYQPFVEALRWAVAHTPPEDLSDSLGPGRGELVRLAPELSDLVAGFAPATTGDPDLERARLFDAVVGWLRSASADAPVVLVLDDLHWAGRPTLQLIRHLVRSPERLPLLLVGTYRDTDLARTHPLAEALADFRREVAVERVRLSGLDHAGVHAFVEAAAGHDLGADESHLVRVIHEETDGNPFFVGEMLYHLGESGAVYQTPDGRWHVRPGEVAVPEGVREVVGRRVSRLSEPANAVLASASVIGQQFGLNVLTAVSDLDMEVVEGALEEALGAGLVREVPDARLTYRFSHALVRSTLYEEISTARRVRLHRRVGEAIETVHAAHLDDHAAELAHHFSEAAASGDAVKAVDYCRRAGHRALDQVAFDEAVLWSERALDLHDGTDASPDPRRRCELQIELGDAQRRAGDPRHRETLLSAGQRAHQLGADELVIRAAVLNGRFGYALYGAVDAERVAALEAAMSVAVSDRDRSLVAVRLAGELTFSGEAERVTALLDEGLALARRCDAADTVAWAIGMRLGSIWTPGTLPERRALTTELVELARRSRSIETQLSAGLHYFSCIESGDVTGAARNLVELAELAESTKRPDVYWTVHVRRSALLALAGRLDEAEEAAAQAHTWGLASGIPEVEITRLGCLLPVLAVQDRAHELLDAAEEAFREFEVLAMYRALFQLAAGHRERATAIVRDATADGLEPVVLVHKPWTFAAVALGLTMPVTGTPELARELYRMLEPYPGQFSVPPPGCPLAAIDHALAACAFTFGDLERAEVHLRGAISVYERMGAPVFAGRAQLMLADLLRRMNEEADAERAEETGIAALRAVGLEPVPLTLGDHP